MTNFGDTILFICENGMYIYIPKDLYFELSDDKFNEFIMEECNKSRNGVGFLFSESYDKISRFIDEFNEETDKDIDKFLDEEE